MNFRHTFKEWIIGILLRNYSYPEVYSLMFISFIIFLLLKPIWFPFAERQKSLDREAFREIKRARSGVTWTAKGLTVITWRTFPELKTDSSTIEDTAPWLPRHHSPLVGHLNVFCWFRSPLWLQDVESSLHWSGSLFQLPVLSVNLSGNRALNNIYMLTNPKFISVAKTSFFFKGYICIENSLICLVFIPSHPKPGLLIGPLSQLRVTLTFRFLKSKVLVSFLTSLFPTPHIQYVNTLL